jgi:hypothetical protein
MLSRKPDGKIQPSRSFISRAASHPSSPLFVARGEAHNQKPQSAATIRSHNQKPHQHMHGLPPLARPLQKPHSQLPARAAHLLVKFLPEPDHFGFLLLAGLFELISRGVKMHVHLDLSNRLRLSRRRILQCLPGDKAKWQEGKKKERHNPIAAQSVCSTDGHAFGQANLCASRHAHSLHRLAPCICFSFHRLRHADAFGRT